MAQLHLKLFGHFGGAYEGRAVQTLGSAKAHELLCYLVLNRDRSHSRELVASVLWERCTTAQSKAYLRKALWQLQSSLRALSEDDAIDVIDVSSDCLKFSGAAGVWIDVDVFEAAYEFSKGMNGSDLSAEQAARLGEAVKLYDGDLLEDWFQDWCIYERERFRHLHFGMLDKLVSYYASRQDLESTMRYGEKILYHDPAREATHQQLMRLRYVVGDRTGAIRQYESCQQAIRDEFDLEPAEATRQLYRQILDDEPNVSRDARPTASGSVHDVLRELKSAINLLAETQERLRRDISMLEKRL